MTETNARPPLGTARVDRLKWDFSQPTWGKLRFGLLAVFAVFAVGAVLFGQKVSTYDELKQQIAGGSVGDVRVIGEMPSNVSWVGFAQVRLEWREGAIAHVASVRQASSAAAAQDSTSTEPVVIGSVSDSLRVQSRAPVIEQRPEGSYSFVDALGWRVPTWMTYPFLLVVLAWLILLVNGPEPLWGTRWAWGWVGLIAPLALVIPVFLLVAGTAPGVPDATSRRRITGGWALAIILGLTYFVG